MYRQFTDLDVTTRDRVETKPDEVVTTLRRAAQEIRERGHIQWELCKEGRVCVRGAIVATMIDKVTFNEWSLQKLYEIGGSRYLAFERADNELSKYLGGRGTVEWNNAVGRTAAEVIVALEGAADARQAALSSPAGMRG